MEPEGLKVVDKDHLLSPPTDADYMNMNVQKGSGAKDNSRTLSNANTPTSVPEPKPLSS